MCYTPPLHMKAMLLCTGDLLRFISCYSQSFVQDLDEVLTICHARL